MGTAIASFPFGGTFVKYSFLVILTGVLWLNVSYGNDMWDAMDPMYEINHPIKAMFNPWVDRNDEESGHSSSDSDDSVYSSGSSKNESSENPVHSPRSFKFDPPNPKHLKSGVILKLRKPLIFDGNFAYFDSKGDYALNGRKASDFGMGFDNDSCEVRSEEKNHPGGTFPRGSSIYIKDVWRRKTRTYRNVVMAAVFVPPGHAWDKRRIVLIDCYNPTSLPIEELLESIADIVPPAN